MSGNSGAGAGGHGDPPLRNRVGDFIIVISDEGWIGMDYEGMSLEEFIRQPQVIPLHGKGILGLEALVRNTPYMRIGKQVRGEYAVLYADSTRYNDLLKVLGTSHAEMIPDAMGLLGRPALEAANIAQVQHQPYLDLRGRGVLVGVIDTGIDYTKKAFQHEDGSSKVRYIWDQTLDSGTAPAGFSFGSEYTNEQINKALQSDAPLRGVPSMDTVGHGTFLAAVAAAKNDNEFAGAAPDSELIVVKLRRLHKFFYHEFLIPDSQENVYSSADVMLAIDYMLDRAHELKMPIAICLGLGSNMGGHDGFTILEQYISSVSNISGVCICAAAGNESNAGHHMVGKIDKVGGSYDVQIRVPENANSFLAFFIVEPTDRMTVTVKSPTNEVIPRSVARSGIVTETKLTLEKSTVREIYYFPIAETGVEHISVAFVDPTPGIWTITLHGEIIIDGKFHGWMHLTNLITEGIEFITPEPYNTVVTPGTSPGCITCGAYNHEDNSLYINSSWGPTRNAQVKPDLVAPGVDILGVYPMGSGKMTGTSVAAGITAGACALLLQWGIVDKNDVSLNTYRIKSHLIRGAKREENLEYPNARWGYGRLDLYHTFEQFRNL